MTPFEWDEEVPQPKPPVRRCELIVRIKDDAGSLLGYRDATQADIARALGVTETRLAEFLDLTAWGRGYQPYQRPGMTFASAAQEQVK